MKYWSDKNWSQEIHQWFPEYYISQGLHALASNCGQKTYSILSYSIGITCLWAVKTDVIQLASNVWNWIDIKPFNWYHMSGIGLICHHSIGIASLELIEHNTIYEYDTIQLVPNARNLFKLRIFLLRLKCTSRTGFESESFLSNSCP